MALTNIVENISDKALDLKLDTADLLGLELGLIYGIYGWLYQDLNKIQCLMLMDCQKEVASAVFEILSFQETPPVRPVITGTKVGHFHFWRVYSTHSDFGDDL